MGEELYGGVGGGGGGVKVSLSGNNTLGVKTLISTGTMYVAGGSNITVSQDANSITIIGETNSGATTFLAGAGSLGNTSGTTGLVNNQLYLAGGNNITLSQSTNGQSATLTISAPNTHAVQTGISSIVASDTTYTSGQVVYVGSNMVTVKSGANQSVIIDATQTVQPEGTVLFGVSSGGNTLGTTGLASGTGPRLVFVGGNNITLSQSLDAGSVSGTITISGPNIGGAQTGISGISGSDTVYTSGTVKFTGSNIVTVRSGTGQALVIDASTSQSVQTYNVLSAGGNTSGTLTSFTSGTVVLFGGNNVTLSQSSNSITISGAEGGGAGISTYGNTAGTTGIAGEQLILVGGSNITLSQSIDAGASNATLTIIGASGGGAGFSAGLSGGNTSGDTGSVTGRLLLAGGNNITLSGSTNAGSMTITISAGASGAGGFDMTVSGNTSGTLAAISSGTLTLAGGNNITLSQAGNAVTISGPTGGGAGMGGSGNSYGTSGSVGRQLYFVGSDNISLSQSVNGSSATLTIIGATQAGGSFSAGVSSGGNTSGNTGTVSNRLVLAGGNNVTLSQSTDVGGATVTISAGASGAGFTAGMSDVGNTSGTTGLVPGQIVFVGGNNVTLSQSINVSSATITISAQNTSQSVQSYNILSASGNTSGTLASFTSGTLVFAGGNNITLSQSSNTITISAANAGGAQTGISGIAGSDTTYTSGTVVFTGTNNITVQSGTGQRIIISGPTGGGAGMGTAASGTAGTTGTVGRELYFYPGTNVTLSQSVNGSSASLSIIGGAGGGMKVGASNIGNTLGETGTFSNQVVFAGGNNITLSGATNSDGVTYTISGPNAGGAQTGISGISASDTVYTSGTVKFTGSNNVTVKSGTGQAVVIDASFSQSAQTGISSIINSETTYTSGAVSFLGSNIVTVKSGAGQALYIDATVPAQTAQTGISGVSVSDTVYTSGTVKWTGSNIVTVKSGTGQAVIIDATVPAQSVQTWNVVSASGNTAGTLNSYTSGTIVLAGGNNITLSQSSNSITISGPTTAAQTVQTYNVLSASGNTSGTLTSFTSGTVVLAGGNNITLSQSSNTITISGPTGGGAGMGTGTNTSGTSGSVGKELYFYGNSNIGLSQSVNGSSASLTIVGNAGAGGIAASLSGNTSGTKTVVSSGTLYLAGGNNITLSQDGQSVTISGANVGGAQTGISGIADSATTVTVGTVQFSNANGVSFGLNGSTMTASVSQSVQPEGVNTIGMSNLGNTAGTSGVVNGSNLQYYFAGGNNVTLSQSINGSSATLTISGVNTVAQTAQTGISGLGANGTTFTSGTVVFSDYNNVSFGTSGAGAQQTITASASYPAQSNQNIVFYATSNTILSSQGTINASSIILKGNDKLSVGVSNGSLIFEAGGGDAGSQTLGMSNLGNSGGTSGVVTGSNVQFVFAGSNNITLSQSINGSSGTISIYGGAGGGGAAVGMGATGNTAGNTFSSTTGTVYIQGTNNITVSGSTAAGSLNTIWISGPTGGGAGMGTGTNTSGTSGTVGKQLYFYGNSNIGLSQSVDGSSASLTITAGGGGGVQTIGMSNVGNTSGDTTPVTGAAVRVVLAGGNNVTLSQSTNGSSATVTISAAAQSVQTQGMVSINGSTGAMSFNAGDNMSLSTNGSSLTFINVLSSSAIAQPVSNVSSAGTQSSRYALADHAHVGVAGINVSGTATTWVGNVMFSGTNITLVTGGNSSAGSIGISAAAPGGGATVSEWMPPGIGYSSFTQMGQSSLVLFPVAPPYYVTATQANLWASISVSTSSNSSHDGRISLYVGVYTRNASTLSLASSGSVSHSWNVTGTTSSGSVVGWRALTVPIDVNMTPGQYWIGVISATATTNANWFTASNMGLIAVPAAFSGPLGATNNTNQFVLGGGVWSAQSAALPASVAFSHITATSASTARPIVNFVNVTI